MFEAMDGRVRAGPSPASSAGHRASFIRAVRDGVSFSLVPFSWTSKRKGLAARRAVKALAFALALAATSTSRPSAYVPSRTKHDTSAFTGAMPVRGWPEAIRGRKGARKAKARRSVTQRAFLLTRPGSGRAVVEVLAQRNPSPIACISEAAESSPAKSHRKAPPRP